MSLQTEVDSPAHQNRVDRYLELGFTNYQAELLANARQVEWAKDSKGVSKRWANPLNWHRVAKTLQDGCSHELAVQIFS